MLLVHHPVAYELLVGAAVTTAVGELVATCLGHVRDGFRQARLPGTCCCVVGRGDEAGSRDADDRRPSPSTAGWLGDAMRTPRASAVTPTPPWSARARTAVALSGGAFRDWAIHEPRSLLPPCGDDRAGPAHRATWCRIACCAIRPTRDSFSSSPGSRSPSGAGSAPRPPCSSASARCCRASGSRSTHWHARSGRSTTLRHLDRATAPSRLVALPVVRCGARRRHAVAHGRADVVGLGD